MSIGWKTRSFALLLGISAGALADTQEQPVGLVLSAGGGKLLRVNTETMVAARAGDLLFNGDQMKTEAGPSSFLYCPSRLSSTLGPASEVVFNDKQLKVKSGKITDQKQVGSCFLPQTVRVAVASQQHYGVSLTRGLPDGPGAIPRDKLSADVLAELKDFDAALKADPNDQASHVAIAAIFEKYKLWANAKQEYKAIGQQWPDAIWIKSKLFDLDEKLAAAQPPPATEGGKTYALLVGISEYQKLGKDEWLRYADADARSLAEHFKSPRGGGLPPENIVLLTNKDASTSAVRNAFDTFLKAKATKKDTVFILVAGHGVVESPGSKKAYIVTNDSDLQDLASTALPMASLQTLVEEDLGKVGRVILFVDVCRAGTIGSLRSNTVNSNVEKLADAEGEMLMLLASRPKELSLEGQEFGGGHGAFSYALLKGLGGAADKNNDGVVTVNEIIDYVRSQVATSTADKQHPVDKPNMDNSVPLSDVKKPGIEIARWPILYDSRDGEPLLLAAANEQEGALSSEAAKDVEAFQSALAAGRLLPDQADNAFTALHKLDKALTPARYLTLENQLRVALENKAQQVLLAYLAGDQTPPAPKDFQDGALYMKAAAVLTPESLYLQARQAFFEGRSTLFAKDYVKATERLEQAVRIDPAGAYSYNALGIGYLEQADFPRATSAFRDAARRAPHWSYPLHNLAVASVEMGDYKTAIKSYQEAMRLTPNYFYLPYNLGLVYQRMNRRKDADAAYKKAIALSPDAAEPYNALGALRAFEHKRAEAEKLYRQSLEKNPKLIQARHNLALLLLETESRQPEAIQLLQQNLRESPEFLASRLSLAEAYSERGELDAAIGEYRQIVAEKKEYTAAHKALGGLLEKRGDLKGAMEEYTAALEGDQQNTDLLESLGDVQAKLGDRAAAQRSYDQVIDGASDRSVKKRVRQKKSKL